MSENKILTIGELIKAAATSKTKEDFQAKLADFPGCQAIEFNPSTKQGLVRVIGPRRRKCYAPIPSPLPET